MGAPSTIDEPAVMHADEGFLLLRIVIWSENAGVFILSDRSDRPAEKTSTATTNSTTTLTVT